ncbi:MAG TPA: nucleoside triphosphate pyrophosphohydrolase, partial [Actinomycetota bacterium]|nr:nucleoside triphosphate pyrophosphohydrolase [Actinomycetota bacterium]
DDIPRGLPALLEAAKTQKRAAGLGWSPDLVEMPAAAAVASGGPGDADALGDSLFALVALARARGIDAEGALRKATARFRSSL